MKLNIIGVVGVIILFISLALPWWMMTLSPSETNAIYSGNVAIYPYQATASVTPPGSSLVLRTDFWYGWAALALVILGGLLGIAGSLLRGARVLLVGGGLMALLSIIIFAVGLQSDLSNSTFAQEAGLPWPALGLFVSGTFGGYAYTTYLSFGFWLALAATIIMLFASLKKPKMIAPTAPPPTSA
ncbi:MAG: hypothetical protein ABSC91_10250 [Candidatus Bathyarchaeia archaeon]